MIYRSHYIYSESREDLHGQPLITFSRAPPSRYRPSTPDGRLSSEICHIRALSKRKINTSPFSFSYPRWFLNFCTFVNSQTHEQNDMNITNANVFVPYKLLQVPPPLSLGRTGDALHRSFHPKFRRQRRRWVTTCQHVLSGGSFKHTHTHTPHQVSFFPMLICTLIKLTSASLKKYFTVKRI